MKKRIISFVLAFVIFFPLSISLSGCFDFLNTKTEMLPQIDNSTDLIEYTPTEDDGEYDTEKQYYKSNSLDLVTEVHGNYSTNRPFVVDENDENKRIYQNIYFYVDDYFQLIYYKNVHMLGTVYAILSDETDEQYVNVLKENGKPYQIDITQEGIYNLVVDITTFGIDMQRVGDIDAPVYETIKSCNLYIHNSVSDTSYSKMTLNTETKEYYIEKRIALNATIMFVSDSHNSHYKMTLNDGLEDKYLYWQSTDSNKAYVHIGGTYKVYFNAKTYVLRLELQNADTATYFCQVGFNQGNELNPQNANTPYLFEYEFVATGEPGTFAKLPEFFPKLGMNYKLSVVDEGNKTYANKYVKESGTYKLTINLRDFTLTVEKI